LVLARLARFCCLLTDAITKLPWLAQACDVNKSRPIKNP
jgi:hypothetical protein